jgi:hypothetical protein
MLIVEESRNFIFWIFITKREPKIVKTISDYSKGTILIFRAFKTKIFL